MNEPFRFSVLREDAALAAEVRRLEQAPVDGELALAVTRLQDDCRDGFDEEPHLRVRLAALWTKIATWAESQALTEIAAGGQAVGADDPIARINFVADLALATRSNESWADRQINLATQLHRRLTMMASHLARGALTLDHARALTRAVDDVDDAAARRIDADVVPRAVVNGWTPAQLAAAARRFVLRLDPDGGAARHDQVLDRSANVTSGPEVAGLGWLSATGDAVTVADILELVDARAEQLQKLAPDTPIGRVRFAALGDLVLRDGFTLFDHVLGVQRGAASAAAAAEAAVGPEQGAEQRPEQDGRRRRRSRRREVIVTVDLATLLGLRDDPASVVGFGPIPARLARLLAADATLRRMVTDPVTGDTLDLGRRSYAPTETLVTAIRAADETCRFPGCTRASRVQIDHRLEWSNHGETRSDNLQLLCGRHHALKTAGLWHCERSPDGSVRWTGPDGQTAVRHPGRLADAGAPDLAVA